MAQDYTYRSSVNGKFYSNGFLCDTYRDTDGIIKEDCTSDSGLSPEPPPPNSAPVGSSSYSFTAQQNTPFVFYRSNLLEGYSDSNNNPLTVLNLAATNGVILQNGTEYTYIPDPDYLGPDTITYDVSNGSLLAENRGSVSLTVDNVTIAKTDPGYVQTYSDFINEYGFVTQPSSSILSNNGWTTTGANPIRVGDLYVEIPFDESVSLNKFSALGEDWWTFEVDYDLVNSGSRIAIRFNVTDGTNTTAYDFFYIEVI